MSNGKKNLKPCLCKGNKDFGGNFLEVCIDLDFSTPKVIYNALNCLQF